MATIRGVNCRVSCVGMETSGWDCFITVVLEAKPYKQAVLYRM